MHRVAVQQEILRSLHSFLVDSMGRVSWSRSAAAAAVNVRDRNHTQMRGEMQQRRSKLAFFEEETNGIEWRKKKRQRSSSAKLKIVIPDQCSFSLLPFFFFFMHVHCCFRLFFAAFVTSWWLMLWARIVRLGLRGRSSWEMWYLM